jgi:putative hydrolase of the HAD superfamily
MRKKAIILDLDNTIYPVSSIGDKLFKSLLHLISDSGEYTGDFNEIKAEIFRRPFQFIADEFSFSEKLKSDSLNLLADLTYDETIEPFKDYKIISRFPCKKFLVTAGFPEMQQSKIRMLGIGNDFEKIVVIDPGTSDLNKTDIFRAIMNEYNYKPEDVIVVGDDLNSEIKAGKELGIETVLYDFKSEHRELEGQKTITNFSGLEHYL